MRRLPPPVRARACRSAYTRACACVRVPGYERHTRVCARANDLFLAGVVQPPDALFGATHGHATVRRLFLFSTSPAFFSPSLLPTTFSSVYFPPFLLELFFPSSPTRLRASHSPSRVCPLHFFFALQFLFPSSRATLGWMKCSRKTARGRTNDRVKRGY